MKENSIYLDKLQQWCAVEQNEELQKKLLYEDDYGTKIYAAGRYDEDNTYNKNYIAIRIVRMFCFGIEPPTTADELQVSIEEDFKIPLEDEKMSQTEIKNMTIYLLSMINKSFQLGQNFK